MKHGVLRQVVRAGVLPAVLVTIVLSAWLTGLRIGDLHTHQRALGQLLASQLAPAAEYGLFSGNAEVLQRLVDSALRESDVRAVRILRTDGTVIAEARLETPRVDGASALALRLATAISDSAQSMVFRETVIQPATDLGDFDLLLPHDPGLRELGSVEVEVALRPAIARQIDAAATGIALLLGAMLFGLLLARRLGTRIAAPIQRLAGAMQRLRHGDRDVRIPETSANELGQLESGLNLLADEIRRTQQELEQRIEHATAELQQTVEALEVSNVELDLARKRALAASVMKTEFLAAMSHEIRTPMSAIIGYTELLSRSNLDSGQVEYVTTIQRSADALLRIISDILDLSRIEAGKLPLAPAPFDTRECVDGVVRLLMPLATAKGLRLRRVVRRNVPGRLVGDAVRLQQVLTNLLSNAIKYTESGTVSVCVEASPSDDDGRIPLEIRVEDTGIGIPAEVQHQLFRAFSQAGASTAQYPGSGLGLVICSRLVEAMGGEIELDSEPGRGTRVVARLVLDASPDDEVVEEPLAARVALVEPDDATREHLAQLVERLGCEVVECVELPTTGRFELVLDGRVGCAPPDDVPSLTLSDDAAGTAAGELSRYASPEALRRALRLALGHDARPDDSTKAVRRSLVGTRVLVVDDHRINRELLVRQLRDVDADPVERASATAALEAFPADVDVVLLDLQMPDMDGTELAARLRTRPEPPVIIAVTANAMATQDSAIHESGIAAILVKPVDTAELADRIVVLRERRAAIAAAAAAVDAELRTMLAEDLPQSLRTLHDAAVRADTAVAQRVLHDLAGIAGSCRLTPLMETVKSARRHIQRGPAEHELAGVCSDLTLLLNEVCD